MAGRHKNGTVPLGFAARHKNPHRPYFGTCPAVILRPGLTGIQLEQFEVDVPDAVLLPAAGQVEKPDAVEAFRAAELGRQLRDVVAGADHVAVAGAVVEPGEERAEKPGRYAGIGRAGTGYTGQRLFDFIHHDHAGRHGVDNPQGLADVRLCRADQ